LDLALPITFVVLVAISFLLLWFGFFEVRRPRRRLAMFVFGLVLFSAAAFPTYVALVLSAR
jgi:hypothetical protein